MNSPRRYACDLRFDETQRGRMRPHSPAKPPGEVMPVRRLRCYADPKIRAADAFSNRTIEAISASSSDSGWTE